MMGGTLLFPCHLKRSKPSCQDPGKATGPGVGLQLRVEVGEVEREFGTCVQTSSLKSQVPFINMNDLVWPQDFLCKTRSVLSSFSTCSCHGGSLLTH